MNNGWKLCIFNALHGDGGSAELFNQMEGLDE